MARAYHSSGSGGDHPPPPRPELRSLMVLAPSRGACPLRRPPPPAPLEHVHEFAVVGRASSMASGSRWTFSMMPSLSISSSDTGRHTAGKLAQVARCSRAAPPAATNSYLPPLPGRTMIAPGRRRAGWTRPLGQRLLDEMAARLFRVGQQLGGSRKSRRSPSAGGAGGLDRRRNICGRSVERGGPAAQQRVEPPPSFFFTCQTRASTSWARAA
jgi:hypothetical protein